MGCAAGERNLVLYTDGGRIAGRDHQWLHDALTVTVAMFRMMRLETNLENTKSMVCTPGFTWGKWGEQAYKRWEVGKGEMFRERKRIRVSCTKCGANLV